MLSDLDRQRYARHLLLPELGERGQLALCAARVQLPAEATDGSSAQVAADYLGRAGVQLQRVGAARSLDLPSAQQLRALSGGSELLEAAAAQLAGAFAAVELIKSVTGVGEAAPLPAQLCLDPEHPA